MSLALIVAGALGVILFGRLGSMWLAFVGCCVACVGALVGRP